MNSDKRVPVAILPAVIVFICSLIYGVLNGLMEYQYGYISKEYMISLILPCVINIILIFILFRKNKNYIIAFSLISTMGIVLYVAINSLTIDTILLVMLNVLVIVTGLWFFGSDNKKPLFIAIILSITMISTNYYSNLYDNNYVFFVLIYIKVLISLIFILTIHWLIDPYKTSYIFRNNMRRKRLRIFYVLFIIITIIWSFVVYLSIL